MAAPLRKTPTVKKVSAEITLALNSAPPGRTRQTRLRRPEINQIRVGNEVGTRLWRERIRYEPARILTQ